MTYERITEAIRVRATPEFRPDRSDPNQRLWFWAYRIDITNLGARAARLRARHWRITDAAGRVQDIRGAGVVGEEPLILPGETFTYTSGCPLTTPSGFMTGSYTFQDDEGALFEVAIPTFSLDVPSGQRSLN